MTEKSLLWMPGNGDLTPEEMAAAGLKKTEHGVEAPRTTWNVFPSARERRRQYESFMALTGFLHEHQIANIIFLDRSARPAYVGVKECWKLAYPKEPRPGMYFMNTLGFMSIDGTGPRELEYQAFRSLGTGEEQILRERPRFQEDILADLERQYAPLLKDRHEPMMLFDICTHSGSSIFPVKNALEQCGCDDLIIGTMNQPPLGCPIRPDFYYFQNGDAPCHPFGASSVVRKSFESVASKRNPSQKALTKGHELRQEIRDLIKEQHTEKSLRAAERRGSQDQR